MKVALVHDYLKEYGGAERVLEALHEIFPDAPVYTAYYNPQGLGSHAQRFKDWNIKTSWLQLLPLANKLISPLRILAPMIFESFDLREYDLVISSCSVYFAKAVITKPSALHISYIHTPPRYLYGYATSFNYKKHWWTKIGGEVLNHFLRIYDFETSQRPDILVANSKNVAERIKKFYRRDSVVIYPPVEVNKFKVQSSKFKITSQNSKLYYLSVSRLVRGKGADVIVEACTKLNVSLKVVGSGPELESLKKLAGKKVEFLGQVKDEDLPGLYHGAKATIVASEDEDFGIVPIESMAAGTPVIAVRAGGYLETVIEGKTGRFFDQASVASLIGTINCSNDLNHDIKSEDCIRQAEKFSKERFKREILKLIDDNINLRDELPRSKLTRYPLSL